MVKVYPRLNSEIMFIGFIQRAPNFNEMDPPKQDFENFDQ